MKLQQQMRNFSVRASQCTCCSLDHVDPTTGEEKGSGLPCSSENSDMLP